MNKTKAKPLPNNEARAIIITDQNIILIRIKPNNKKMGIRLKPIKNKSPKIKNSITTSHFSAHIFYMVEN